MDLNHDSAYLAHAACRGVDPNVFFAPDPRGGWSSSPARNTCATCPVKVDCLEGAVARRERDGIWAGAGGDILRTLTRAHRARTHNGYNDPHYPDVYDPCGCPWCAAVTEHFVWLDQFRTGAPVQIRRAAANRNGPGATHGRRITYNRGCRDARCRFSVTAQAAVLVRNGVDVVEWWIATYGATHGLSVDPGASDVEFAQAKADAADLAALNGWERTRADGHGHGNRRSAA